ncbi:hemopexin repeat-containing protein, partial [Salmonella sp. s51884]|uniref:hemopexin repeat-containing protein n=1 Tax=Salmonella sp. s51884 TaxID=3159654 RepID=UPI00397EE4DD
AFQWSNGKTYLFDGEQYWRYNDDADWIDSGYPLTTTRHWLGCPTDGPTVPMKDVCVPKNCSGPSGCVSGKFDVITRTSNGNTYAFQGNYVIKLKANGG